MKRITICLFSVICTFSAPMALANCRTDTFIDGATGRMTVCTTCCYGPNNCTTYCSQ